MSFPDVTPPCNPQGGHWRSPANFRAPVTSGLAGVTAGAYPALLQPDAWRPAAGRVRDHPQAASPGLIRYGRGNLTITDRPGLRYW